jgi:hypothetical protein
MKTAVRSAELQRCLNSPYLFEDDGKKSQVQEEMRVSQELYDKAVASFDEGDEATGLKQAWGAMYRAARALAYKAGYRVEQLHCMQVVLREHYGDTLSDTDIDQLRIAQELIGPPAKALERARDFKNLVSRIV